MITQQPKEFCFRNVMIHPLNFKSNTIFVTEDTLTSVGEDDVIFLALRNQTANERVKMKGQTVLEKAVLTSFVFNFVPIKEKSEALKLPVEFINRVHSNIDLDTSSELSSFAQSFITFD